MKACTKCGRVLPLESFYRDSDKKGGYPVGNCKECYRERVHCYRILNADKVAVQQAVKSRRHRKQRAVSNLLFKARFPEKIKGPAAVARAVQVGKLQKMPCEICGNPDVEGHHPDYSKPLEVVWLCRRHHRQLHAGRFELLSRGKGEAVFAEAMAS